MLTSRSRFVVCVTCVFSLLIITHHVMKLRPNVTPLPVEKMAKKLESDGKVDSRADVIPSGDSTYIITQTFGGQMTRAIRNMMVQQCWGASLGQTYLVEPFSSHSMLYHSSSQWSRSKLHDAVRFSEFYDLRHYNLNSQREGSIELVTWEKFLQNAPRQSVVLVTPEKKCNLSWKKRLSPGARFLSNCSFNDAFRDFVNGLKTFNFKVIKVVCVDCSTLIVPLTPRELHKELYEGHGFQRVTVLVNAWRNYVYTSSWLQLPKLCKLCENPSTSIRLRPSKLVKNHTQYYKKTILKSRSLVAVMIRTERFLVQQVSGKIQTNLSSCINRTLQVLDKIKTEMRNVGTFLTLDIGRFGSHGMQTPNVVSRLTSHGEDTEETIAYIADNTIKYVYNGTLSRETWEETFVESSGGITDTGYIAMLQRNIATEADCLILMGGGSFQQVAAYQYIQNHHNVTSNNCFHTVCVTSSFDNTFKKYV